MQRVFQTCRYININFGSRTGSESVKPLHTYANRTRHRALRFGRLNSLD